MNYFINLPKDILKEIIYKLDYKTIYEFQITNKNIKSKIKEICIINEFWEIKAFKDFNIDKEEFYKYKGIVTNKQRYVQYLVIEIIENDKMNIFNDWYKEKYTIIGNTGLGNYLVSFTNFLNEGNEINYGIGMFDFISRKSYPCQVIIKDNMDIDFDNIKFNICKGYHYNYMIQKLICMKNINIEENKKEIYQYTDYNKCKCIENMYAYNMAEAVLYFRAYYEKILYERGMFLSIKYNQKYKHDLWNRYYNMTSWIINEKILNFDSYTFENITKFLNSMKDCIDIKPQLNLFGYDI